MSAGDTPRVLVALPTPPPYSSPEIVAALLPESGLGPDVELIHVRTNAQDSNVRKGHLGPARRRAQYPARRTAARRAESARGVRRVEIQASFAKPCPVAEAWHREALSLPCSTGLTEEQQT